MPSIGREKLYTQAYGQLQAVIPVPYGHKMRFRKFFYDIARYMVSSCTEEELAVLRTDAHPERWTHAYVQGLWDAYPVLPPLPFVGEVVPQAKELTPARLQDRACDRFRDENKGLVKEHAMAIRRMRKYKTTHGTI